MATPGVYITPDWRDDDDARLAALLEANHGGESLDAYIRRVSPRHLPPRHIEPIMELWERSRTERVFACIELPPRHAKTTTGLHGFAWRLYRDPALTHGFATFGDDYAASRSRICRVLARAGGVQIAKDASNLHEWRTPYGGGLIARGVNGEWTGKGIDGVLLIDDPFKNRRDAESVKIRENVWDAFTDVLWTRLEGGSCFVQHTRWHDDDLIGRLMQGRFAGYRFERVYLPAIAEEPDDILGRAIGEALWPERIPLAELRRIEESIGPYGWASLFQQRPRPKGADVFETPSRFILEHWLPDGHRILICADPAATEDTRGDHSALFVLAAKGKGADMQIWILYGWRGRESVPAFARRLHWASKMFWNAPVVVEAVGGFKAVPQTLKEIEPALKVRAAHMGVPDDGTQNAARLTNAPADKFTRSQPVAAAWNGGRVHVPVDSECVWNRERQRFVRPTGKPRKLRAGVAPGVTWADELLAEAGKFTGVGDIEDDQIDALAHGYNDLFGARRSKRGQRDNNNPFG